MRIATMIAPYHMEFLQKEIPPCAPQQVRIRIKQIGICGSDIHVWHGQHPFTDYPIIQGHEFAGVIDDIGPDVDLSIGQLVTAMPQIVCNQCNPCKKGRYNICENLKVRGFQANGCGQDYFITDVEQIISLPNDFSLDQAVFMEPMAVAVHAVNRLGDIKGENIVISGAGTIGNLIAQLAQVKGANVLLLDIEDNRLNIAKECGIAQQANVKGDHLEDIVKQYFGAEGFYLAIEASGAESALQNMIPTIEKGGIILIVAVYSKMINLDMARISEHEIIMKGSMMYQKEDWEEARAYLKNHIHIQPLITHRFGFEDWAKAYQFIDDNPKQALKVMIKL